jgi:RNA polymerase sigma factor for flagellar operon FliA
VYAAEFFCHCLRPDAAPFEQVEHIDMSILRDLNLSDQLSMEDRLARLDGLQPQRLGDSVRELKNVLIETLDGLGDKQRIIIALHYFEGLSLAEIAQLLDVSLASAQEHLSGALARLNLALQIHI